jgi:hypothetical protein
MTITNFRADNALTKLVDAALPIGSGKDGTGLWIRIDYRARNEALVVWKGEIVPRASGEEAAQKACAAMPEGLDEEDYPWYEDLDASADIHLLVFRPTNYTQVYGCVTDSWSLPPVDEDWRLYIDHDSCWRTDGWRLLDEMRHLLSKAVTPKWFADDMKPTDVRYNVSIARVERVTMETKARHTEPYNPKKRRVVTSLGLKKD